MTRRKGVYGNRRIWERVEKWDKKLNPKDFAIYLDQTKPLARELFTEYQGIQETIMKTIKPIVDRYGSEFARFQAYMWYAMQCWYIKQRYKDEALKKMTNALYIYWTIAGLREEILREIACMIATCPDPLDVIVQNYLHVTIGKPTMSINYNELEQVITKAIIDALVQEKLTDLYDNVYNAIKNNPTLQSIIQLLQTLLSKYMYDIDVRKNLGYIISYINYTSDEWKRHVHIIGNNVTYEVVDNNLLPYSENIYVPFEIFNKLYRCFILPSVSSKLLKITVPANGQATVIIYAPAGLSIPTLILTGLYISNNNITIDIGSAKLCNVNDQVYTVEYNNILLYRYFTNANQHLKIIANNVLPITFIDNIVYIRLTNNESNNVDVYLLPITFIPLNYLMYNKVPILTRYVAIDQDAYNYIALTPNNGVQIIDIKELLSFANRRCMLFRLSILYVTNNLSESSILVQSPMAYTPICNLGNLSTNSCPGAICSLMDIDVPFKVYYEYGTAPLTTGIYVTAQSNESTYFFYGVASLLPVCETDENTWTENVNISQYLSPWFAVFQPVIYPAMNNYIGARHIKSAQLSITTGSYQAEVYIQIPTIINNTMMIKVATIPANTTQTINIKQRNIGIYIVPQEPEQITITGTVEWSDTLLL